jgi:hypothetical protein
MSPPAASLLAKFFPVEVSGLLKRVLRARPRVRWRLGEWGARPPTLACTNLSLPSLQAAPVVGPVLLAAAGALGIMTHVMVSDNSVE